MQSLPNFALIAVTILSACFIFMQVRRMQKNVLHFWQSCENLKEFGDCMSVALPTYKSIFLMNAL